VYLAGFGRILGLKQRTGLAVIWLAVPVMAVMFASPFFVRADSLGATGMVSVDANWHRQNLPTSMQDPVIIAGVPSKNGSQPGTVGLRNVGVDGFDIAFREWSYLDGSHLVEDIAWLAAEKGRVEMSDGTIIEAGVFYLRGNKVWSEVSFEEPFPGAPTVLLSAQTHNDNQAFSVEAASVSEKGFHSSMQEEEALLTSGHGQETIGYLAIYSPRSGSRQVKLPFGDNKSASVDHIEMNHGYTNFIDRKLQLQEEQSKDSEMRHIYEGVDTLMVGDLLFAQIVTNKGGDTVTIRYTDFVPVEQPEEEIVDDASVELDLSFDGTLEQSSPDVTVESIGLTGFGNGFLGGEKAALFSGNNQLKVSGLGSSSSFTISGWLFIDDLLAQNEVSLIESRDGTNPFRWYFKNDNPTDTKQRVTKLVFETDAIKGGEGPSGNYVESGYDRFGELSKEFIDRNNHAFKHRDPDNWAHIALTYDSENKTVTTFMYGSRDSVTELSEAHAVSFENMVIAPTENINSRFVGRLKDLRIQDRVLTKEEVADAGAWEPKLWGNKDIDNWLPAENVIYVDGANGDDANNGSSESPVKTIRKGLSIIPGKSTRLVIRPGKYYEHSLRLYKSGTRFEPVIIEAETPGTVEIDGAVPLEKTWTPTNRPGEYTAPWDRITGHWTRDGSNNIGHRDEMIIQDGRLLRPLDAWAGDDLDNVSPQIVFDEGMYFIDEANKQIIVRTDKDPNDSIMEQANNRLLLQATGLEYIVLRGLIFQHGGGNGWAKTVWLKGSKHVVVEDSEFKKFSGKGLVGGEIIHKGRVPLDFIYRRLKFQDVGGGAFTQGHSYALAEDIYVGHGYWRMIRAKAINAKSVLYKNLSVAHITMRRLMVDEPEEVQLLWFDNNNWNIKIEESSFYKGGSNVRHSIYFEINPQGNVVRNNSFAHTRGGITNWSDGVTFEGNYIKSAKARWGIIELPRGGRSVGGKRPYSFNQNNFIENNTITAEKDSALIGRRNLEKGLYANNRYFGGIFGIESSRNFIKWFGGNHQNTTNWAEYQRYEEGSSFLDSDPFVGVTPEIGFEADSIDVNESAKAVLIPLNMSLPVDQHTSVQVKVNNGTAVEGEDFRLVIDRDLKYLPLQVYRSASLIVHRDDISEGDEQFTIELVDPQGATLGDHSTLTVNIKD